MQDSRHRKTRIQPGGGADRDLCSHPGESIFPNSMRYYPIFVDLGGKHCLVVGAGNVGARKLATLLECGPESVTVVDPAPPGPGLADLCTSPVFHYEQRPYRDADLDGKWLVIASTTDEDLNRRIGEECRHLGILCNVVDQPEESSFVVPATLTQGDLVLAVSTSGASPALARMVRTNLETMFGQEYASFLAIMGRLRPLILDLGRPTTENTALFRELAASELLRCLARGDTGAVARILEDTLPPEIHPQIPELLHDLP